MKKSFLLKIVMSVLAASMVVPLAATASASASTSSGFGPSKSHSSTTESLAASGLESSGVARSPKTVKYTTFKPCKPARVGSASCLAIRRNTYVNGIRQHGLVPATGTAFGAPALRKAYGITAFGARYKVIAIVDAMHSSTAFDDLTGYRNMYQLGAIDNCGEAGTSPTQLPSGKNPCFVQLNQSGKVDRGTQTTDSGWAQEIALDLQVASAVCPHCSILLVEADSASFADLNAAVRTAADFSGVVAISNSYGGPDVIEARANAYGYATTKGIAVTASSGDSGYGVSAPASFPSVIGVGGTSLTVDKLGRWASESAWTKGGSGCSRLNVAAPWQKPALTGCSGKSVVDVAAVADPATGVTVYFDGQWYTFGGTSASSPLIAALFALKSDFGDSAASYLWGNSASLHDITTGATGRCLTKIWCNAGIGFDGPTGWGTPNGTEAF